MPLPIPSKESKDMESYRRVEEVRRYVNKELKVSRSKPSGDKRTTRHWGR